MIFWKEMTWKYPSKGFVLLSIIDKLDFNLKMIFICKWFYHSFGFVGQNHAFRLSSKTCGCFKSIFAGKRYSYLYEDFLTKHSTLVNANTKFGFAAKTVLSGSMPKAVITSIQSVQVRSTLVCLNWGKKFHSLHLFLWSLFICIWLCLCIEYSSFSLALIGWL